MKSPKNEKRSFEKDTRKELRLPGPESKFNFEKVTKLKRVKKEKNQISLRKKEENWEVPEEREKKKGRGEKKAFFP